MPQTAAFTNFSLSGGNTSNFSDFNISGSFDKGWNFYKKGRGGETIYIEVMGMRDNYSGRSSTGNIIYSTQFASNWSSGASSASDARGFFVQSTVILWPQSTAGRSYGYSIRPTKE